jgi:3-polyprenyl-4-hydroxybenzoate decarboxylase
MRFGDTTGTVTPGTECPVLQFKSVLLKTEQYGVSTETKISIVGMELIGI